MSSVTEPLRAEHRELRPHIDRLLEVADGVGEVDPATTASGVDEAHNFLVRHLLPHARAEDLVLYPVVGEVLGATGATATMSRDHAEVARLTDRLAELRRTLRDTPSTPTLAHELRAVLYGLHALVTLHLAKEEEVYLPLLDDALDTATAESLFRRMSEAAAASTV
jgi:iron-sulfur cluster repair protein YtfE (RIC family)